MPIDIKIINDDATIPAQAIEGDAGLDLASAEQCRIEPGQRIVVGTGIAVAVPTGCAGLVLPRSGLASKHGITVANAPGLIDSGYRGELKVALVNLDTENSFEIKKGMRVAQLVVINICEPVVNIVEKFAHQTARGEGGFGHTGTDSE